MAIRIQNLPIISVTTREKAGTPKPTDRAAPVSPYEIHRQDILGSLPVRNPVQLDWMIALRMRATGHDREEMASPTPFVSIA